MTINIGSNEGWGLSSTEALMAGRVIINNVTGGLQDQMRFEDENGNWIEFNDKFASNHTGRYKTHGVWAKPVFPASINLQGSIPIKVWLGLILNGLQGVYLLTNRHHL